MSYAVKRAEPASSSDAPTSATVFDFICLFTHDLKRKQKRWQDGHLKYHTFNRRVMVYDDRGNFIGDAHWQAGHDLVEGEELQLDRGSAIVQVADCTGERQQDLTEMLDKRAKEVEKRRATAAARTPASSARVVAGTRQDGRTPPQHLHVLHRPLTSIVGSPGAMGRAAIPAHSPFEARQADLRGAQGEAHAAAPPAKRRKRSVSPPSKLGHARSLFGATLSLTGGPTSSPALARGRAALRDTTNVGQKQTPHVPKSPTEDDAALGGAIGFQQKQATYAMDSATERDENAKGTAKTHAKQTAYARTPTHDDRDAEVVLVETRPRRPDTETLAASGAEQDPPEEETIIPSTPPRDCKNTASTSRVGCITNHADRATSREPDITPPRATRDTAERPKGGRDLKPASAGKRARLDMSGVSDSPPAAEKTPPRQHCDPASASKTKDPTGATLATRADGVEEEPPPETRPRTELRIRSRQKRGLLMISEKRDHGETSGNRPGLVAGRGENKVPDPGARSNNASDGETCQARRGPNRRETQEDEDQPLRSSRRKEGRGQRIDVDAAKNKQRAVSPDCLSHSPIRGASGDDDQVSADDVGLDSDELKPKRPTRAMKEKPEGPGPRISRMARKSVKCKEIFGFKVPGAEELVPTPLATAASRVDADNVHVAEAGGRARSTPAVPADEAIPDIAKLQPAAADVGSEGNDEADDNTKSCRPAPRLANPASRGRKAASKEDAAGQAPRVVVAFEPPAPTTGRGPATSTTSMSDPDGENKKHNVVYPGFSSARGGTWSKHAEDLLGMSRPERARPKQ